MIVATLTVLYMLMGSGSFWLADLKDLGKEIEQVMPAGEQRDAALAVIDAMKDDAKAKGKNDKAVATDLDALLQDHDAKADALESVLLGYRSDTAAFYTQLTAGHFKLKEYISETEWAEIHSD